MSRLVKLSAAVAAVALLAACKGSLIDKVSGHATEPGATVERSYPASGFTRVALGAPADVEIQSGGAPGIRAVGGANFLDELEVVVEDGTLHIRSKDHKNFNWHWDDAKAQPHFVITGAAAIEGVDIGGSGTVRLDGSSAKTFTGNVGGSGDLKLAQIAADEAKFNIGGSGSIVARGTATSVEYNIGGSGDIDAAALKASQAEVSIAGSGGVKASASGSAKIAVLGSGDVDLAGGAKCEVSKMGSGNVNCH